MLIWSAVVLALMGIIAVMPHPEDSWFFNCHWNGNGICGESAIWHGYVNW